MTLNHNDTCGSSENSSLFVSEASLTNNTKDFLRDFFLQCGAGRSHVLRGGGGRGAEEGLSTLTL